MKNVCRMLRLAAASVTFLFAGCPAPSGGELSWVVMGTTATVRWNDSREFSIGAEMKDVGADLIHLEGLLNAHDPTSELSRLAPLPDAEVLARCTPEVRPCYEAAFRLRDQTDGVFNPRWRGRGTLDLGAIAKGFAVDYALRAWTNRASRSGWRILVDLGGNLRAAGTEGWKVGIKDGDAFALEPGQACATSAAYYRGDHIRDGRTGAAVSNAVYSVTVVHPSSAMLADGLSTVMYLLGRARGEEFLRRYYPEARACWIAER